MTIFGAVDWSSSSDRQCSFAWGKWDGSRLEVGMFSGPAGGRHLTHGEVREALADLVAEKGRTVVGFDFPFSFAESVRRQLVGERSWRALAEHVGANPHDWGRLRGFSRSRRRVEKITSAANPTLVDRQPFTGRQAWTGIAFLSHHLHQPLSILPMWAKEHPQAILAEIYPRTFLRGLRKTNPQARRAALQTLDATQEVNLTERARRNALSHDGPFDALMGVWGMWTEEVKLGLTPEMMTQAVKAEGLADEGWIYGVPWSGGASS